MSFSQKHEGKIFVPWFNTEEWLNVYNLITSNDRNNLEKALMILNIWKCRIPLLPAGVEGSLILLETMIADFNNVPDAQIVQNYSITLLRFLNICAANNKKQGTFNKSVSQNEVPKWLVDIRHDIAHDHRIPSKSLLELALSKSFEWLIDKYWKIQINTISDYVVNTENSNAIVLDTLNAYIRLNLSLYNKVNLSEYDKALLGKVNYYVSKRYNKTKTNRKGLLVILEEMLNQAFSNPDNKNMARNVARIVADKNGILSAPLEKAEDGTECISETFKRLWSKLLNIMYENEGFLPALLTELWCVVCNEINETTKKIGYIWISDLLNSLLKLQEIQEEIQKNSDQSIETIKSKLYLKNPEYNNSVELESLDKLYLNNLIKFEATVLDNPNKYVFKFIERLMKFNKTPVKYQVLIKKLMEDLNLTSQTQDAGLVSKIMTVDDLPVQKYVPDKNKVANTSLESGKWTLIKDTSAYKDLPLGVLPTKSRDHNPVLVNIFN